MQLKGEQLAAHLERGLQPVYLVYGDEPLLVIEAADAIRAAARRRGFDEREVLTAIAGFNWNDLYHAAGSMSLFGGRTLIDLRIPTGKPGREGSAALQEYCARPSPDSLLLVTMTGVDWRDEKAAWMSAWLGPEPSSSWCRRSGRIAGLDCRPPRRQQQSASADGLLFIAERVEGNLLAAHQEILKLGVLYPPGALSLEQIREAVLNVARYDLDGLREAMLAGDVARLTRTLDGLQQEGEAPLLVLWAMTEEVRAAGADQAGACQTPVAGCAAQGGAGMGSASDADQARLAADRWATRAEAALAHAAGIDRMIKGAAGGDPWDEFRQLGLHIAAA
jgi:DNA polymerase-3 subunit delta